MDTALSEIITFVQNIPPFNDLPETALTLLVKDISISYVRKNETLPPKGMTDPRLYLLRKGALSYLSADGELIGKYGEGDLCSIFCQPENKENQQICVQTDEDTLLYSIGCEALNSIGEKYPSVSDYFSQSSAERLKHKMSQVNEEAILASSLMNTSVSDFYQSPVASIIRSTNIQQAAIKMTEFGYSCLVVVDGDSPIGIVTDKDIRRRCVAQGLPIDTEISKIMTENMSTIDIKSNAYDALMMMTAKHIHHLPVTKRGAVVGMVTVTDLLNNEGHNAVNLSSIIHKANTVAELAEISLLLPKLQIRLAKLGSTADHVGKSISAITMAFTKRLIELAEQEYGESPVPYAWLAAGSQARQEQMAHSDQDNALIIANEMQPEDDAWFEKLAHFVCNGLDACGFILCPGDIMATNKQWRQPQNVWKKYFATWVDTPNPKALLNSSVFFDLDTIYGDTRLLDDVRKMMLNKTKGNSLFIAHLTKNALGFRPPLGFFRDFVLIQNGKHKSTLDLKHNGTAPIVDLARIYALSEGISAVNTIERIQQAAGTPSLTKSSAANLIDAFEFLATLRMKHQANKLQKDEEPSNYMSPKEISKLEREHLKDAFKVIKTLQDSRQATY